MKRHHFLTLLLSAFALTLGGFATLAVAAAGPSPVRPRVFVLTDIENEPDVGCVAAPVRDRTGQPVAAISIAGPAGRVLPRTDELGSLVAAAANTLSRRLGHIP